jgi:hypothetical protein
MLSDPQGGRRLWRDLLGMRGSGEPQQAERDETANESLQLKTSSVVLQSLQERAPDTKNQFQPTPGMMQPGIPNAKQTSRALVAIPSGHWTRRVTVKFPAPKTWLTGLPVAVVPSPKFQEKVGVPEVHDDGLPKGRVASKSTVWEYCKESPWKLLVAAVAGRTSRATIRRNTPKNRAGLMISPPGGNRRRIHPLLSIVLQFTRSATLLRSEPSG